MAWFGGLHPALLATLLIYFVANIYVLSDEQAFKPNAQTVAFLVRVRFAGGVQRSGTFGPPPGRDEQRQVVSVVESIADGFLAVDNRWRLHVYESRYRAACRGTRAS